MKLLAVAFVASLAGTAFADPALDTHILRFPSKIDEKECQSRAKLALDTLFKTSTLAGSDTVQAQIKGETFQIECLQKLGANAAYFSVASVGMTAEAVKAHINGADKLMQK